MFDVFDKTHDERDINFWKRESRHEKNRNSKLTIVY